MGAWSCEAGRVEEDGTVTPAFPVTWSVGNDGALLYSSGSKIDHRGFNDRGGGIGEWEDLGDDLHRWRTVEVMYAYPPPPADATTPNFAGRIFLDAVFKYDPVQDTLCSGRPIECPDEVTHVYICTGLDTTNCVTAQANTLCRRLSVSMPATP